MGNLITLRIHIPSGINALPLLESALRAIVMRTDGITEPATLLEVMLGKASEAMIGTAPPSVTSRANTNTDTITIALDSYTQRLTVTCEDKWVITEVWVGDQPVPTERQMEPIGTDESLGVGLLLIRQLMNEVVYQPHEDGNRWILTKRLSSRETPLENTDDHLLRVALDLPATYRYLNVVGACIEAMIAGHGSVAAEADSFAVQLAAQETLTNIVKHAYRADSEATADFGRVAVTLILDQSSGVFIVETQDQGTSVSELVTAPITAAAPIAVATPRSKFGSKLLSGGALLFVSATLVNAGNYLFNLLLGRWLGPAAFADLSLIVTLFLVTSFLTAGVQMPTARFVAQYAADGNLQAVATLRRWAVRQVSWLSIALALIFALGSPLWATFFATQSFWPFAIFGLLVPFYLLQGVDRGVLQGLTRFRDLAISYQVEMWSRLVLSMVLVGIGLSLNGAVLGVGLSFIAAWWVGRRAAIGLPAAEQVSTTIRREMLTFVGPVLVAQLGQILINNSDVLIVRHFFVAETAGHYAALALTGRIVFFATWSVVTAMFPIVAQRHRRGESHRMLLYLSLGIVLGVSFAIVAATTFFPEAIVRVLFGSAYLSIAPLLWLYALATMFYALANVVISYRLSIGDTAGTYFAIAAGVAQVALLWFVHATLDQVVWVQFVLMTAMFIVLLGWDFMRHVQATGQSQSRMAEMVKG